MAGMLKSKEERVKEGIALLRRLKETGVPMTSPSFKEIQGLVSDWVIRGELISRTVHILRSDRDAVITLPAEAAKTAQIVLKKIA
jgi:hypothetical protein